MQRRLIFYFLWCLSLTLVVPVAAPAATLPALPGTGVVVEAYHPPAADRLPDLQTFSDQVQNGQADQIVGLYLPGLAALPVLPQPAGEPYHVTDRPEAVTLFSDSLTAGSIGLLAHSHLAGRLFNQVTTHQQALLIYGDGRTTAYQVDHLESYQALQPDDPYSEFTSLYGGSLWDSQSLFAHVYGSGPHLILQTCLEQGGQSNWGRLFVIAVPTPGLFWKGLSGSSH